MITAYENDDEIPVSFRTFREAIEAVAGHVKFDQSTVGSNGFSFNQDNKCIGVI